MFLLSLLSSAVHFSSLFIHHPIIMAMNSGMQHTHNPWTLPPYFDIFMWKPTWSPLVSVKMSNEVWNSCEFVDLFLLLGQPIIISMNSEMENMCPRYRRDNSTWTMNTIMCLYTGQLSFKHMSWGYKQGNVQFFHVLHSLVYCTSYHLQ